MSNTICICQHCWKLIRFPHGNQRYHPQCAYVIKKERSVKQYAQKSTAADPLWLNEKILRENYESLKEIDPDKLADAGFDFNLHSEQINIKGKLIFCMRNFGFFILNNKKLVICKI